MSKKPDLKDIHLWTRYVKDVKPIAKKKETQQEDTSLKKKATLKQKPIQKVLSSPPLHSPSLPPLRDLGRKELRNLKLNAEIDLHGQSLEQAYDSLEHFLLKAQEKGYKTVLVITGKGSIKAENTIRHQLGRWLEHTPLRRFISFFHYPAKQQDGGTGACYVGIRKKKINVL